MYNQTRSQILNYILQKFKLGRTVTMTRILDLSQSEQESLRYELEQEGIHSSIEEELITAWVG